MRWAPCHNHHSNLSVVESPQAFWKTVDVVWRHGDGNGNGFTIQLNRLSFFGRLVVPEPKADAEAGR